MAAYSWYCSRNGLWLSMFVVRPYVGRCRSLAYDPNNRSQTISIPA
jgi:hypothetical protein